MTVNEACERCGCSPCLGEFVGCPESPEVEVEVELIRLPLADDVTAAQLHESVMAFLPSGYLSALAEVAEVEGVVAEELVGSRLSPVLNALRAFCASLDVEASARGISPSRLFARMALHGTTGGVL